MRNKRVYFNTKGFIPIKSRNVWVQETLCLCPSARACPELSRRVCHDEACPSIDVQAKGGLRLIPISCSCPPSFLPASLFGGVAGATFRSSVLPCGLCAKMIDKINMSIIMTISDKGVVLWKQSKSIFRLQRQKLSFLI